jgi:hypothetical protein
VFFQLPCCGGFCIEITSTVFKIQTKKILFVIFRLKNMSVAFISIYWVGWIVARAGPVFASWDFSGVQCLFCCFSQVAYFIRPLSLETISCSKVFYVVKIASESFDDGYGSSVLFVDCRGRGFSLFAMINLLFFVC